MESLGVQLRARAKALNLSDAEVARRAGLGVRRYGNYVTGDREPDFQTFLRICEVLDVTPNDLLGFSDADNSSPRTEREQLQAKLIAASNVLELKEMRMAVKLVGLLTDNHE